MSAISVCFFVPFCSVFGQSVKICGFFVPVCVPVSILPVSAAPAPGQPLLSPRTLGPPPVLQAGRPLPVLQVLQVLKVGHPPPVLQVLQVGHPPPVLQVLQVLKVGRPPPVLQAGRPHPVLQVLQAGRPPPVLQVLQAGRPPPVLQVVLQSHSPRWAPGRSWSPGGPTPASSGDDTFPGLIMQRVRR